MCMLFIGALFAVDLGFGGALGLGSVCSRSLYIEIGRDFNGYAVYLNAGYNRNGFLESNPSPFLPILPGFRLTNSSHGPFSSLFLNWETGSCGTNTGLVFGFTTSYFYSLEDARSSIMLIPSVGTFFKSTRDNDSSFIKLQLLGTCGITTYDGLRYVSIEAALTIFPLSTATGQAHKNQQQED